LSERSRTFLRPTRYPLPFCKRFFAAMYTIPRLFPSRQRKDPKRTFSNARMISPRGDEPNAFTARGTPSSSFSSALPLFHSFSVLDCRLLHSLHIYVELSYLMPVSRRAILPNAHLPLAPPKTPRRQFNKKIEGRFFVCLLCAHKTGFKQASLASFDARLRGRAS
jgi:hypothetical protein